MRSRSLALILALAVAGPVSAQGFMGEMHRDLNDVQKKVIDLATTMPENTYDYRPGPNVRSVREVFLHIASENYYIGGMMGKAIPAATTITADYKTVDAYEKKALPKAQIIAELTASFTFLHQALGLTTDANAGEVIKFFGMDSPRSRVALGTVTHLHEHLGQSIAYARTNKIVPPWSK